MVLRVLSTPSGFTEQAWWLSRHGIAGATKAVNSIGPELSLSSGTAILNLPTSSSVNSSLPCSSSRGSKNPLLCLRAVVPKPTRCSAYFSSMPTNKVNKSHVESWLIGLLNRIVAVFLFQNSSLFLCRRDRMMKHVVTKTSVATPEIHERSMMYRGFSSSRSTDFD